MGLRVQATKGQPTDRFGKPVASRDLAFEHRAPNPDHIVNHLACAGAVVSRHAVNAWLKGTPATHLRLFGGPAPTIEAAFEGRCKAAIDRARADLLALCARPTETGEPNRTPV